jgi:hypothetical protein
MAKANPRIARERKTVEAMIRMYYRDRHGSCGELCTVCRDLQRYAEERLEKCPFGESKPTCANCPVHCYRPEMRERIRAVMQHAGPRMIWKHPVLALFHLLDVRRKTQAPSTSKDRDSK